MLVNTSFDFSISHNEILWFDHGSVLKLQPYSRQEKVLKNLRNHSKDDSYPKYNRIIMIDTSFNHGESSYGQVHLAFPELSDFLFVLLFITSFLNSPDINI